MEFNEKTLEDIIWDNSQSSQGRNLLLERGISIEGTLYRQVELGNYGRADLISVNYIAPCELIEITVYELKKGVININALMQAARYVTALKRHGFDDEDWEYEINYKICLIGDSFDTKGDFAFLFNEIENVEIYTYEFRLTGIFFNEVGKRWSRTEENLNEDTKNKIAEYLINRIKEEKSDDTD